MREEMNIDNEIMVTVWCLCYNQEPYLRESLEGFVMQKTNFRFEVLIHDDASTDRSAEIIREYEQKYPDIIKPVYQTENQYSQRIPISRTHLKPRTKGRYIALCEGDDFWIDPLKLQKQVDFLEAHPDYSMVCSDAVIMSPEGELDFSRFSEGTTIPYEKLIRGGGGYVMTATQVYRKELLDDYPDFCQKCHVGDYPLQLYMGFKGKVYYFAEKMAAYRLNREGSWTARQATRPVSDKIKTWRSEVDMLNGMDGLTKRIYKKAFRKRIAHFMYWNIYNNHEHVEEILSAFKDVKISFRMAQRMDILLIRAGLFSTLHKYKTNKQRLKNLFSRQK